MGGSGQIKVTENGDINKAIGVAPSSDRENIQMEKGGVGTGQNLKKDIAANQKMEL